MQSKSYYCGSWVEGQKQSAEVRDAINGEVICHVSSAGQDLSDRSVKVSNEVPDLGESVEKNYNPLIRSIMTLDKPVICAVNGVSAGAGANIALACDIVLAARSAKFIQAFCKIGLVAIVIVSSTSLWSPYIAFAR